MKNSIIVPLLLLCLLITACVDTTTTITGAENVDVYDNTVFQITETINTSTVLTARGTIKNNSKEIFYPTWYIEGSFYTDNTYSFKLGGDNYTMTFSLEPGETTSWELKFSSDLYTESDYPNFAVKNLRAYKED